MCEQIHFVYDLVDLTGTSCDSVYIEATRIGDRIAWTAHYEPGGEEIGLHECWHDRIDDYVASLEWRS